MAKSAIVKRSACIRGRKTSISLEDAFWNYFKDIAASRGVSPSVLITEIEAQNHGTNLSSAVRLFVLDHATSRLDQDEAGQHAGTVPSVPSRFDSIAIAAGEK